MSLRLMKPNESFIPINNNKKERNLFHDLPETRPLNLEVGVERSTNVTFRAHIERFRLSVAMKKET